MNLLQMVVRSKFALTTRAAACRQASKESNRTAAVAERLGAERAGQPVRVPPMPGIDPEMREWSVFMVLEHDVLVNRQITRATVDLALAKEFRPEVDMKTGVLPSAGAGPEQVEAFRESVRSHLDAVAPLPSLRGGLRLRHPVFGEMDAHGWNCMFAFHLMLHRRQVEAVERRLRKTFQGAT